jgi:hypothetical protein
VYSADRQVADGFDVVAIRVSNETAKIVGVILGKDSGWVEDLSIDAEGSIMKTMNSRPIARRERDVQLPGAAAVNGRSDPERGTVGVGEPNPLPVDVGGLEPKGSEDNLVEGLAPR